MSTFGKTGSLNRRIFDISRGDFISIFFAHSRHKNEQILHQMKVQDPIYKSLRRSFFIISMRELYIFIENQNIQLCIEIKFSICECLLTKLNQYGSMYIVEKLVHEWQNEN